jgi:hypothetical protein
MSSRAKMQIKPFQPRLWSGPFSPAHVFTQHFVRSYDHVCAPPTTFPNCFFHHSPAVPLSLRCSRMLSLTVGLYSEVDQIGLGLFRKRILEFPHDRQKNGLPRMATFSNSRTSVYIMLHVSGLRK